jgi:hypothetical protein
MGDEEGLPENVEAVEVEAVPVKRGRGRPRVADHLLKHPRKDPNDPRRPVGRPRTKPKFDPSKRKWKTPSFVEYKPPRVGFRSATAKQPGTNRPPPGSQPELDPATLTITEIRLQEALLGKKVLTPLGPKSKKKGFPGTRYEFKKGHTVQPTLEQVRRRPQPVQEIMEMFQLAAPEAFAALRRALLDPKLTVTAANSILDRGYGKTVQQVQLTGAGGGPLKSINVEMSAEEAARLYAETIAAGALPAEAVRRLTHDEEEVLDPEDPVG